MKTLEEKKKRLTIIRDAGIWTIAVLLFLNFWLWNNHDMQVRDEIKPKLEQNALEIEYNTRQLDSLIQVTDSLSKAIKSHDIKFGD